MEPSSSSSSSAPHGGANVNAVGVSTTAAVLRLEKDVPVMQLTRQLILTYNKINQVRFGWPVGGRQELRNVRDPSDGQIDKYASERFFRICLLTCVDVLL